MIYASKNFITDLKKQKRENRFLLFLDNPKIIKEAHFFGLKIKCLLKTKACDFNIESIPAYIVDEKTLNAFTEVKTPQGVCAMLEYIPHIVCPPVGNFLVLDGVQDAGNVGTLLRSAYGAGFNFVYLIDSAAVTNLKVIRSSGGACFKLAVITLFREEFIELAKKHGLFLVKADMRGEDVFGARLKPPLGIVVGNESRGVSKDLAEICQKSLSIPMQGGLESLNAGVSGSILMYVLKNSF